MTPYQIGALVAGAFLFEIALANTTNKRMHARVWGIVIFVGFLLCMLSHLAMADEPNFWLEPRVVYKRSGDTSQVQGGLSGALTISFGYYAFGQVRSDGSYQTYAGPTIKPFSWLDGGIGFGKENGGARKNLYFLSDLGRCAVFGTFENGSSGAYHKIVGNCQVSDRLGFGAIDDDVLGRGPRLQYKTKKGVAPWIAILRSPGSKETSLLLGAELSF